jgi:hypothetical protein
MKSLYYLQFKLIDWVISAIDYLKSKRYVIVPAIFLTMSALSFATYNGWRLFYMVMAGLSIFLLKPIFWEVPEMIYLYLGNKETTEVGKQRRFDNYTLPVLKVVLIAIVGYIIISAYNMATTSSGYYPGWKSDINNMWANKFMQWVVDNLFPVKTYYSTFK